jgi:hypothetical protein
MCIITDERGATLVEALVAGALLLTLASGTASLITLARGLSTRAEQLMSGTALATARLQILRSVPWTYGIDGSADEVAVLTTSGIDTLSRNTSGFFELANEFGEAGSVGASAPAFAVRWAIGSTAAGAGETRSLEVCVFAWPAADNSPPLVCVASARARQP